MPTSGFFPPAPEDDDQRDAVGRSNELVAHPPLAAVLQAAIGSRLVAGSSVKALLEVED